ncbi:hypothetical protein [Microvirga sp. P5_D2]
MTLTCTALPAKYANPFDVDHPAVPALLNTKRSRTSYAPHTMKNRAWASRELYCLWLYGLLPHLPRSVFTRLPLQPRERPTFAEIKADLGGKLQGCTCTAEYTCHSAILAYVANAKGYAANPPLRGPPPERRRRSSDAERDEIARDAYRRSNCWGI